MENNDQQSYTSATKDNSVTEAFKMAKEKGEAVYSTKRFSFLVSSITTAVAMVIVVATIFLLSACGAFDSGEEPVGDIGAEIFTVSFDSAGGSSVEPQNVEYGKKAKKPNQPTRDGYEFLGWYVCDEKWSFIGNSVTEDVSLKAKWVISEESWKKAFDFDNINLSAEWRLTDESYINEGYFRYVDKTGYLLEVGSSKWDVDHGDNGGPVWLAYSIGLYYRYDDFRVEGENKFFGVINTPYWDFDFYTEIVFTDGKMSSVRLYPLVELGYECLIEISFFAYGTTVAPEIVEPEPDIDGGEYEGTEYAVTWDKTTVIFELTKNSNNDELSSGCERYYAGASTGNYETIDNSIKSRNAEAYKQANVDVSYIYAGADKTYGWGKNTDRIFNATQACSKNSPDMYCNFAYDMTCAAIKGSFANLFSTAYGNGGNFFAFTKSDYVANSSNYFDAESGQGYFYSYMESLSLSPKKMYCLASNYSTDLVRAFLVVPVNLNLMNSISLEASTGDKTGDQKFDFRDFYELVWAGEWNYTNLAKYSNAVYKNLNTNKPEGETAFGDTNLGDVIGFAAGASSGLTSSGILYTTSVKIINKTVNADGTWSFSYPATNNDLNNLADALYNLFTDNASKGIVSITSADANAFAGKEDGDLKVIRSQFADNKILFGGVISVGSLEDEVYQNMRQDKGFGIVPVPVYKNGDSYQTLVHNIGKVISISATTTDFEQCTAFLDYQSRNSSDILSMYYDEQLASKVEGAASSDNKKMLTYIRNQLRDNFDKMYEDVIADFTSDSTSNSYANKWHTALARAGYRLGDFSQLYGTLYSDKQGNLTKVIEAWNKLP